MKTNTQLEQDIRAELKWEPRVRDAEIGLAVKDGVVTLTGMVESYAQRTAAEQAAKRVGGVRVIADDLTVKLPGGFTRTDTELAHQVANALAWDIEVPSETKITARVENGWVTLEGEVDWQFQRLASERAVRYLTGVKGLTNLIRLKVQVSTVDVSKRIEAAFHRTAAADVKGIRVVTVEGRVTLNGSVRTFAERQDAEAAAWAAPGVTAVDDLLLITA